jgi:hypothetical protein
MTFNNQSVKERVSAEEWDVRVQLAACYRFAAHFRMTDLIYKATLTFYISDNFRSTSRWSNSNFTFFF